MGLIAQFVIGFGWLGSNLGACCVQDDGDKRIPLPGPDSQMEAEELIRDVFSEEYKKRTDADKRTLARKLIQQAIETKDDAATQYVLLREARDLATRAGDGATAYDAIDKMAVTFRINAVEMKFSTLSEVGKRSKTRAKSKSLAQVYLRLAEDAANAGDYDNAIQAADAARRYAKRSKDPSLAAEAKAKAKEFTEVKSLFAKVQGARTQLETDPENAAANLVVGRFLCLVLGRWKEGLPYLVKGDDGTLKSLGRNDLGAPKKAKDQSALGDGWWDLSKKESGTVRKNIRYRAAYWYEQSFKKLSGLSRSRVRKRLDEISATRRKEEGWIDLTDPTLFGLRGKKQEAVEIAPDPKNSRNPYSVRVRLRPFPKGEFDGISARVRFGPERRASAALLFENEKRRVMVKSAGDFVETARLGLDGRNFTPHGTARLSRQDNYEIMVLLVDGAYVIYIDGEEKFRSKTDETRFDSLSLYVELQAVKFDRIQFRRKK